MRILFAAIPSKELFNFIPDIGMGYLMSLARRAGHEVSYLDCRLHGYDHDEFERRVRAYKPDVVGMKLYSIDLESMNRCLQRIKRISTAIVTLLGGPHPSVEAPERLCRQFPEMDYAFAGEADEGLPRLLAQLEAGSREFDRIPGLVWRGDDRAHANPRSAVEDLDTLPFPAWDLVDPRQYRSGYSFMTTEMPSAPMIITRGCPYACTYCNSYLITGRHVRRRSIDNVIEEIRLLQRDYGVRSLDICDENFVLDNDYAMEFCERLLRDNIGIRWNCPYGVRLDSLTEELVRMMERAGCFGLSLGCESGSDRILSMVNKRLTVAQIREQTRMIKRVSHIMLQGFFMMGFPTETREEIEATMELARSLPFDFVVFSPLRVTPGTEMYEELVASGSIRPEVDFAGMGHHYFVRSYCSIPDAEMRRLYRKAYLRFYGRPGTVWNLLKYTRSRAQAKTLTNGILRLIRKPFERFDPRLRRSPSDVNNP